MESIQFTMNDKPVSLTVDGERMLLWVLRTDLGLTGAKYGCGVGECGACTIHLDGQAVSSCMTAIGEVGDREVLTIEGLSPDKLHPLQRAWIENNVSQCGYCQPAQIMQAAALLNATPHPDKDTINQAMKRVVCRCGTYQRIGRAIQRVIELGGAE